MKREPVFRHGAVDDFAVYARQWAENYKIDLIKTCLTCVSFNEPMETCNHYKEKPPARIIAYGCNSYIHDDEIPF